MGYFIHWEPWLWVNFSEACYWCR